MPDPQQILVDHIRQYDSDMGPYGDELADECLAALRAAGWSLVRLDAADTMTTYKRADGELISGEFSFVTELDWFENDDNGWRTEIIEERWQLAERKVLAYGPLDRWCAECEADVTLAEPSAESDVYCDACAAGRVVAGEVAQQEREAK